MKKRALFIFGIVLVMVFIIFIFWGKNANSSIHISGQTMGTIVYNVKFVGSDENVSKKSIDSVLRAFNQSLSTYIPDSEISDLNKHGKLSYRSDYFYPVLQESKEIFERTDGAFDPTVGPLIDAWGFGPEKQIPKMDSIVVDSLLGLVGFEKLTFDKEKVLIHSHSQLDFSAIAKGYAVDLVGELLERKGIENYLVEIGGEVRCRGQNDEGKSWSLGIEDPTVAKDEQKLLAIVRLKNRSLATSGNYRNYYERDGKLFAHIIDPRTGYTAKHNLLSASVFAETCMVADAYATAFMVLGLEGSKKVVNKENIDVILIYRDEKGVLNSFVSEGIRPFVELNKAK